MTEGKTIDQLDPAAEVTLEDSLVIQQADGRTRKSSIEQLRATINALDGDSVGQDAATIVGALDAYFEGTGWRDGTGVPSPKIRRYTAVPMTDQRSVTIDFVPDPDELILTFRNGSMIEPASRTGSTFTYPGPDFFSDEVVTILAYPVIV